MTRNSSTLQSLFTYEIDGSNCLVKVCSNWDEFAEQNEAKDLIRPKVQGKNLFEQVKNRETRQIYFELFKLVREHRRHIQFKYRCDSPDTRRLMQMHLLPLNNEHILCCSRIIKAEPRKPLSLLDSDMKRSAQFVIMCGWCKDVKTPAGWLPVEEAIKDLEYFNAEAPPKISHGICSKCMDSFGAMIDNLKVAVHAKRQ